MSGVRFSQPVFGALRDFLFSDAPQEACGVAFAMQDSANRSWLVRDAIVAPEAAYESRSEISATLRPSFIVECANRARREHASLVLVHTHPFAKGLPHFSPVDDEGELPLAEYLDRRAPARGHLAMVIGPDGCSARQLGAGEAVPVWIVGEQLRRLSGDTIEALADERHDRQVRAFGMAGQRRLGTLSVGIVGLGGTGSILAEQLSHLGVRDLVLVDPDDVEITNLNRLAGAGPADIGRAKVALAADRIAHVAPCTTVRQLRRDVVDGDVAALLTGLDLIFLCTDSHASRAVVGQLAYQYLVPVIDMGVSVTVRDGMVTHISGRVQMLAPGLPCLTCTQALDGEQIRREMLTPEQRAADPYLVGAHEPQPAVMSINSTVSSLATTMFLGAVTPMPAYARYQRYDGVRGTVRQMTARIVEDCIVCSATGALARGTSWPLPVRPGQQES